MIIYNKVGAGMVLVGVVVAAALTPTIGDRSAWIAAGIAIVAADLVYRSIRKESYETTPFFHPKRGGNIFFIPMWIIGGLVVVFALAS